MSLAVEHRLDKEMERHTEPSAQQQQAIWQLPLNNPDSGGQCLSPFPKCPDVIDRTSRQQDRPADEAATLQDGLLFHLT